MKKKISPEKVVSGSYGEVWIDDYYAAEATAVEAKVTVEKAEVPQTGTLAKGYKIVGYEGKGTLKMNKTTSFFISKLSDNIQKGKATVCTLITKLDDPDVTGIERVKLTGVTFDELTLANWETKKVGEESMPFTFTGWEVLDSIPEIN